MKRALVLGLLTVLAWSSLAVAQDEDSGPIKPALLVIDIQMPSISGLELLKEIEKLKLKFPILLISGYRNGDITGALASGGPVVYAEKPFNPNEFLQYVNKVFEMFNKDDQSE